MKFKVTYPSGVVEEVEQSDCATLEDFANTKFGSVDTSRMACRSNLSMRLN